MKFEFYPNKCTEMRSENGKYGAIDKQTGETILPMEYDNFYPLYDGIVVLCQKGKFGAIVFEDYESSVFQWLVPCEFDYFHFDPLVFEKKDRNEFQYVFSRPWKKPHVQKFIELDYRSDSPYVYARDETMYCVFNRYTGALVYVDYAVGDLPKNYPCLEHIGDDEGVPVFWDLTNGEFILPDGVFGDRREDTYDLPHLVKPIIINGRNVINIVEDTEGIGIINTVNRDFCHDERYVREYYDEIELELKVTMKKGDETVVKSIPVPRGRFEKYMCIPTSEW